MRTNQIVDSSDDTQSHLFKLFFLFKLSYTTDPERHRSIYKRHELCRSKRARWHLNDERGLLLVPNVRHRWLPPKGNYVLQSSNPTRVPNKISVQTKQERISFPFQYRFIDKLKVLYTILNCETYYISATSVVPLRSLSFVHWYYHFRDLPGPVVTMARFQSTNRGQGIDHLQRILYIDPHRMNDKPIADLPKFTTFGIAR